MIVQEQRAYFEALDGFQAQLLPIYLELIREGNSLMSRQKTIPSVSISVDFFFIQSHVCWLCSLRLLETLILGYGNTRVSLSMLPEAKKYVLM